jgi:hypothetical protein
MFLMLFNGVLVVPCSL